MAILPKAIYRFKAIPIKFTHEIFHRTRTNNQNVYMEPQKTQDCPSNPEKQKPSRKHKSPRLQAIIQSHSNQDSVVLAAKQTDPPMEQNREPRNKPIHLRSINLHQRGQEYKMEKVSSASGARKTGQLHVNQ